MWDWLTLFQCLVAFFIALFIGTLVEYVVHRLMHARVMLYKIHAEHHQLGQGQGWLWEFRDYYLPSLPVSVAGFILFWSVWSIASAIAFVLGCLIYAALAAYAHQVQHENPDLCFWMKRPVHHLHHNGRMWHHNFGILVDYWDKVFGTYKSHDPKVPEPADGDRPKRHPLSDYFRIKWF